jgi:phosphohistidine phosphatase
MLRIYIVRHATAQDKGETLPDFERSLIKRGEKEAAAVAEHLALKYPAPDLMISSFANRAIETAHLFAKVLRYPRQRILLRDTFYGDAKIEDLAGVIRKQPDKFKSLMLFGHDPAFSQLAADLVEGFHEIIPKAGVVVADIPFGHWQDVTSRGGRLVEFTGPAQIKEEKKRARSDLESRLARSMKGVLARVDRKGAAAFEKEIRKSAHRIVKGFLKTLTVRGPGRKITGKRPTAP